MKKEGAPCAKEAIMPAIRRSFAIFMVVGMAMAMLGCGATSGTAPPTHLSPSAPPVSQPQGAPAPLCWETKDTPTHGPCCEIGPGPSCDALVAFARRLILSTVEIQVMSYSKEDGGGSFLGTGVVISENGVVMTAYHVVEGALGILVEQHELDAKNVRVRHRRVPMMVLSEDKASDSALLAPLTNDPLPPPLPIDQTPLKPGEQVWQFGRTTLWDVGLVREVNLEITPKSLSGVLHNITADKIDIYTEQGDSGGPLFDSQGRVRGFASARDEDRVGYYVPIGIGLRALGYTL
jgi:S1-C subfamily serine protease